MATSTQLNESDRSAILKQQQETTKQLNALLEQSTASLSCGPDCQKIKKKKDLEQKYLDAQTHLQTAPIEYQEARKEYYIYAKGEPAYNDLIEKELNKKAHMITKLIHDKFKEEIQQASLLNTYYNSDLVNSKNTIELYKNYFGKNLETEKLILSSHGDVLTNDRKTYYETQELENLQSWQNVFFFFYWGLVIVILVFLYIPILKNKDNGLVKKIITILIIAIPFIVYPIFIPAIVGFFIGIVTNIRSYLPKNVYNNL